MSRRNIRFHTRPYLYTHVSSNHYSPTMKITPTLVDIVKMTKEQVASEDELEAFSTQFKLMSVVTMWYTETGKPMRDALIRVILWVNGTVLTVLSVGLLLKAILTKDLVDRSEAVDILTLTSSACYKMVHFHVHRKEFLDMIKHNAAMIKEIPTGWNKNARFFSIMHCTAAFVCISGWGFCPLLKLMFGEVDLKQMPLPLNVFDPFYSQSVLFSIFYCICYYGLILATQIYMGCDIFLFSALNVANGALEIVKIRLNKLREYTQENDLKDEMHKSLIDCVKLHQRVIVFIKKTDALFRSMFVVDVLHAIISLSFAMLQASESKGFFENVKMVTFISYCFIHQYLNSFFGQRLIDQQDEVVKELIVGVPWHEGSLPMKRSFLIVTTSTQKPLKLSAWSVYTLQYATFLEFVRSMISYYMVLRQVQDESTKGAE